MMKAILVGGAIALASGLAFAELGSEEGPMHQPGKRKHHAKKMKMKPHDIDVNGNLLIEDDEIDAAFAGFMEKMGERANKRFDADGDGNISEAEMAEAKSHFAKRFQKRNEALLGRFDADGNGKLDENEISQVKRHEHDQRLGMRFRKMDTDGNLLIDDNELAAGVEEMSRRQGGPMKKFDTNGDGQLDDAEKAALRAKFEERGKGDKADKLIARMEGKTGKQAGNAEKRKAKMQEKLAKGVQKYNDMVLQRFDANGDGQLDDGERLAANDAFGPAGKRGPRGEGRRHKGPRHDAPPPTADN